MWPRLNVWIMSATNAARVDDRDEWVVKVLDSVGGGFVWKGYDYAAGVACAAPGYADFEVAPGTYLVSAEGDFDGERLVTHTAVVAVHDAPVTVVRLIPDPQTAPPDQGPNCGIVLRGLAGLRNHGEDVPPALEVTGLSMGCAEIQVRVGGERGVVEGTARPDPESDGSWRVVLDNTIELPCGIDVEVVAWCAHDQGCSDRQVFTVQCPG